MRTVIEYTVVCADGDLPAGPRDPDVVRAKALARSQLTGSCSTAVNR
jgi:hypothetical protein